MDYSKTLTIRCATPQTEVSRVEIDEKTEGLIYVPVGQRKTTRRIEFNAHVSDIYHIRGHRTHDGFFRVVPEEPWHLEKISLAQALAIASCSISP